MGFLKAISSFKRVDSPHAWQSKKGTWWGVGTGVASLAYNVYKGETGGKGGGGAAISGPDYYLSDYYSKPQEDLYQTGKNFMSGQPGSYFSPIGEIGGQSFENLLNLVKGDISKGVTEDMARRNIRGGVGTRAIAKTSGDISTKMRWADMERALAGRKWMFGQGRGMIEGVRAGGLSESQLKNQFNINKAKLEMALMGIGLDTASKKGDMWSDTLSSGIGAVGNILGMFDFGGGGTLGSAEGGNFISEADVGGGFDIGGYEDFG